MGPMENATKHGWNQKTPPLNPQPTWPSAASPAGASAVEAFAFWNSKCSKNIRVYGSIKLEYIYMYVCK